MTLHAAILNEDANDFHRVLVIRRPFLSSINFQRDYQHRCQCHCYRCHNLDSIFVDIKLTVTIEVNRMAIDDAVRSTMTIAFDGAEASDDATAHVTNVHLTNVIAVGATAAAVVVVDVAADACLVATVVIAIETVFALRMAAVDVLESVTDYCDPFSSVSNLLWRPMFRILESNEVAVVSDLVHVRFLSVQSFDLSFLPILSPVHKIKRNKTCKLFTCRIDFVWFSGFLHYLQ